MNIRPSNYRRWLRHRILDFFAAESIIGSFPKDIKSEEVQHYKPLASFFIMNAVGSTF